MKESTEEKELLEEIKIGILKETKRALDDAKKVSPDRTNYSIQYADDLIAIYTELKDSASETQKAYNDSPEAKTEFTNQTVIGMIGALAKAEDHTPKSNALDGLIGDSSSSNDLSSLLEDIFKKGK